MLQMYKQQRHRMPRIHVFNNWSLCVFVRCHRTIPTGSARRFDCFLSRCLSKRLGATGSMNGVSIRWSIPFCSGWRVTLNSK